MKENAIKIAISLYCLDGWHTAQSLKQKCDWLKNISLVGIDLYLTEAIRLRYVFDKYSDNEILYRASRSNSFVEIMEKYSHS